MILNVSFSFAACVCARILFPWYIPARQQKAFLWDCFNVSQRNGIPFDSFLCCFRLPTLSATNFVPTIWIEPDSDVVAFWRAVNWNGADSPYILENLDPQTMYAFRFAAKNKVGYGEWSREETHTMPKRAAPEEPFIIAKTENKIVTSSYPDRYELLWSAPPNNGEPIDYFEIAFYPVRCCA